jgi:adhesin transport system outer membrane protein
VRYINLWLLPVLFSVFSFAKGGDSDITIPIGTGKHCTVSIYSLLESSYKHYPSISASKKMILGAEAQKESAKWNYFPTPSIDISQRGGRRGTTFRIDQPLWTGGKLDAISDRAAAYEDEAKYTLGETSYALSQKVLSVLQSLIQADGEIKGFREGKSQLEEMAAMLDKRVSAGVSAKSDRALLNSRISQINADLMMAQSKYDMASAQMEFLIGKKMECTITLKNDRMLQHHKPFKQMQEEMIQTHPTLKKMDAQIAMAKAEKKSATAAVMPDISFRAEHQKGSIYEDTSTDDESYAYVAVSFSTGAGLSALSNIESAKYKMMQAMDEKRVQEQELKEALVADYVDYTALDGQIENMQKTIDSSKQVLESYKRLFIAGKRQWLDLVNASRDLTQSQISLAMLRARWIGSAYRLSLQTGKIDFEAKVR